MAMSTTACSSDTTDPLSPLPDNDTKETKDNEYKSITLTRAEEKLVNGNNDFAFNVFRKTVLEVYDGNKSVVMSPLSITYALGMLNNGAAGETRKQICEVLGFADTEVDSINSFCHKMLTESPTLDKLTKVLIANTIFMNSKYEINTQFKQLAHDYYDAEPETRDFKDGKTLDVINQWASDHTENMIQKVLSDDEFKVNAASYLLNAIYFKGAWAEKFNKNSTMNGTFHTPTGDTQVPMMHQTNDFGYTETNDCQILKLPYGNSAYSMTIILPQEGKTIDHVLASLNSKSWQQNRWMRTCEVDVKLPRFETKADINLKMVMSILGMPRAFDSYLAEFPNFCNIPTYIEMMKQVARIKLDEEGTEAAAVTAIGMMETTAVAPPRRVEFHATRPFLYVISEESTGTVFFIGQYMGD